MKRMNSEFLPNKITGNPLSPYNITGGLKIIVYALVAHTNTPIKSKENSIKP